MKIKICFKCGVEKSINQFYRHPKMSDGYIGKCKICARIDNKTSNGKEKRICIICEKSFNTRISEIKRGGGLCCSRKCYFDRLRKIIKKDELSPNWKGEKASKPAIHDWVKKHRGKPNKCEHCGTIKDKKFEWANKSDKYKRDLTDWIRLCVKCHSKFDYDRRLKKWRKAVKKLGWNIKTK